MRVARPHYRKSRGAARVAARARRRQIENSLIRHETQNRRAEDWYVGVLRGLDLRSRLLVFCFTAIAALLAYRAAFLVFSPSYRLQSALVTANLGPTSIEPLLKQASVLSEMGTKIEDTTISQLRRELDKMVRLTDRTTLELQAQYDAWSVLRGQIKNDGTTYNELRAQLNETQRLQEIEILRLQQALEKAQKPSGWADLGNLALSFVLGVLASILAAYLWEEVPRLKKWWNDQSQSRMFKT